MIKENDLVGDKFKKEFYISKIYDRLIKKKHKFLTAVDKLCTSIWQSSIRYKTLLKTTLKAIFILRPQH